MALGEVDYGLMGVVGGLTAFISFFFGILSGAVGRFYAFAIGQASAMGNAGEGLENCRKWFSLAVTIHSVVPLALMIVCYPIGDWAVRNFLTIPADRVEACVWVFRFVCVSCFFGMVAVPFNAMYNAKQYIAELTIYSFVSATLNACFLYYMVTHPGVWLTRYAFWQLLLILAPNLIIAIRACVIFPECRYRRAYAWNWGMYKQMLSYTGWNTLGSLGMIMRGQGIAILVNKFFGPAVNASFGIANTVNGHANSLASSMQTAFYPVITTAIGSGNLVEARKWAFRFCKFGMLFALIFVIPLAIELKEIVRLWLRNPPSYSIGLCWIMLLMSLIDKSTLGYSAAIMANGNIKWYQIVLGSFNLMAIPLAWVFCIAGLNVYWVGVAMILTWTFLVYGRLVFGKILLDMDYKYWCQKIMRPIFIACAISGLIAFLPRFIMRPSLVRIVTTTLIAELVFLPISWFAVMESQERVFLHNKIKSFLRKK